MTYLHQRFAINERLFWQAVEADNALSSSKRFNSFFENLEIYCTEFENTSQK